MAIRVPLLLSLVYGALDERLAQERALFALAGAHEELPGCRMLPQAGQLLAERDRGLIGVRHRSQHDRRAVGRELPDDLERSVHAHLLRATAQRDPWTLDPQAWVIHLTRERTDRTLHPVHRNPAQGHRS